MAGSSLFRPALPHQAIAALLLIENSQEMASIWSDLRDRYLTKLIESFQNINQSASIKFLMPESFPSGEWHNGPSPAPRHYSELQEGLLNVRFNYASGNKLSVSVINTGIDFLRSFKSPGQTVDRHLIIVAASPPAESEISFGTQSGVSPWHLLAQRFKQADICCHMVLNPHQDMSALEALFDETLRVQCHIEEYPPFRIDPKQVRFRLSGILYQDSYSDIVPFTNAPRRDIPPQRSNTFPPDNVYPAPLPEPTVAFPETNNDPEPSLVTQLQQVHGLTKKKVYGTRPPRQPFFREERVREKYHSMPSPLSVPSSYGAAQQALLPNTGGRVVPPSKVDRIMRINQASPTELHSRIRTSRRGSRVSSPDSDTISATIIISAQTDTPSAPPYVGPGFPSPVSPTFASNPYPILPQPPVNSSTQPGVTGEPTWLSGQPTSVATNHYYGISQQYPDIAQQQIAQHPATHTSSLSPSPPASRPLYSPTTPDATRSTYRNSEKEGSRRDEMGSCASPKRTRSYAEDDERFTFGPEYIATTTALFTQEVLPSYPDFSAMGALAQLNRRSEPPPNRSDFYITDQDQSSPTISQYPVGGHYATRPRQETMYPITSNGHSSQDTITYSSVYASENSSSLKGWAG